jgi:hypothetical protein
MLMGLSQDDPLPALAMTRIYYDHNSCPHKANLSFSYILSTSPHLPLKMLPEFIVPTKNISE